jgi:hypothetical protein
MYSVQSGQMKLVQACLPSLDTGEYRITVNQSVANAGEAPIPQAVRNFAVTGARFALNPDEVYSVYPAANSVGHVADSLPHIILSRRTLPWERTMDGSLPKRYQGQAGPQEATPWMALLLFQGEEAPAVQNVTLEKLNVAPPDTIPSNLKFDPDTGDSAGDLCSAIDIPMDLFLKIAPKKEELEYLAHVRFLNTDNKQTAGQDTEGWFAVVIGNRFPKIGADGIKNTVHLVSLEGLQDYLPGSGKASGGKYNKIRLVSLASWSFTGIQEKYHFQEILSNLSPGKGLSLKLRTAADSDEAKLVKNAVNMGYAALQHTTRLGEKTYSWYRGPFTPIPLPNEAAQSYPCADAAVRYDPATGIFDVSYAAAWQLGRLLALQNPSFADALYKWRRNNFKYARLQMARNIIYKNIGYTLAMDPVDGVLNFKTELPAAVMEYWRSDLGRKLLTDGADGYLLGKPADPSGLKLIMDRLPGVVSAQDMEKIRKGGTDLATSVVEAVIPAKNNILNNRREE